MRMWRLLTAIHLFVFVVSCATTPPPNEEYTLARSAFESAQFVDSSRFAPGLWFQAEELYRKAQILHNEREFADAKKLFNQARMTYEKAENAARLERAKSGEIF